MLEKLKEAVCEANLKLVEYGLVIMTWGNVSAISEDGRFVVIKPSGVDYSVMEPGMMTGRRYGRQHSGGRTEAVLRSAHASGALPQLCGRPERGAHPFPVGHFPGSGGALTCPATAPPHADTFHGSVPCTRALTQQEIDGEYELNTGKVIVETFRERGIDPEAVPGVLVCKHGPFTWGGSTVKSVENALVLETTAHMALATRGTPPAWPRPPQGCRTGITSENTAKRLLRQSRQGRETEHRP